MNLVLLVGERHSGKTSTCGRLAELTGARGLSVGGILAPAIMQAGRCVGYNIVDMATGRTSRLATIDGPGAEQVGRFFLLSDGLRVGREALEQVIEKQPRLVIVDEVGPLELNGGGWADYLDPLIRRKDPTIFTVRRELAATVAELCPRSLEGIGHPEVFDLTQGSDVVLERLLKLVEI